jgi:DNA-binding transcriptional LysR family regulator
MDWNDVRYFLALARLGSVRAAGKHLRVSHSTVARRLEALEAQLDTRLFDRSPDGYVLTSAGREMLRSAEIVEARMADLERAVARQDERLAGVVTVTCGDNFVARLLLRVLATLCATHPALELRFTTDPRPFDLSRREADVAVRALQTHTSPPEALLGTRVAPVVLGSYVAVAHAARLDPERGGGAARWLGFEDRAIMQQLVASSSYPDLPPWGTFDSLEAVVEAARVGLGVAMLPVYVGDADPGLQRLERADLRHVADLWLLSHPDLRHTARIRVTRELVAGVFRDHAGAFRGQPGVV